MNGWFAKMRRYFFAGLFVVLPLILSLWLLYFFFEWATRVTSKLLVVLPQAERDFFFDQIAGVPTPTLAGRVLTFVVSAVLLTLFGIVARNALGKAFLNRMEEIVSRVPLLNKIYPTVREISGTFQPDRPSAFREAVLVEFPKGGSYTIGFVTGDVAQGTMANLSEALVSVFVPTSPNPTTGFLLFLPREKLTPMKISVADAFKLVISGGAAKPEDKRD